MPIAYTEALALLAEEASNFRSRYASTPEPILLEDAVGRVSAQDYVSPRSTPEFDTSAMDGYALDSSLTKNATLEQPVYFRLCGTMAAGDAPVSVSTSRSREDEAWPCVEIMTGARFPFASTPRTSETLHQEFTFDACVPVEQTIRMENLGDVYIAITKPVVRYQHRRFAGNDFQIEDLILGRGSLITAQHVMALATVGFDEVLVLPRLRIGLFSTGAEIQTQKTCQSSTRIPDVNRRYILSSLRNLGAGVEATFIGALDDCKEEVACGIKKATESGLYDIVISTGAVSAGKFDFVRPAIEDLGGRIVFHKVAMRPGHPVLCAVLGGQDSGESVAGDTKRKVVFFGLPGNPIAAAVCLRFIVIEFLSRSGFIHKPADPVSAVYTCQAVAQGRNNPPNELGACESRQLGKDEFRHGKVIRLEKGDKPTPGYACSLTSDQSPAKAKPILDANCFIHFPSNFVPASEQYLMCYPFG